MGRTVLHRLFGGFRAGRLDAIKGNGPKRRYGEGDAQVRLVIRNPWVVPRAFRKPELVLGEVYLKGQVDADSEDDFRCRPDLFD